jgi:broad specificity phosphatase PhoE
MTEIILERHGQTVWTIGEVFHGQIDISLGDTGLRLAYAIYKTTRSGSAVKLDG